MNELLPFQKEGIAFFERKKRGILGDDMGLGKTIQAIEITRGKFPILIICPKGLKENWHKEIFKWTGEKAVLVPESTDIEKVNVVIAHYDTITKHLDLLKRVWRCIILDESHYIGNGKTSRTKSAQAISRKSFAQYKLCLSGTPIKNTVMELPSQLTFVDRLNEFGGFWGFIEQYCSRDTIYVKGGKQKKVITGPKNLVSLGVKLRESCMMRRRKQDVLKQLPDKRIAIIEAPIEKAFIPAYEQAKHGFIDGLEKDSPAEAMVRIEKMKQACARGKMKTILQWIEDFKKGGRKLVVFADHIEIQEALYEGIEDCISTRYQGAPYAVSRFQEDPDTKVIVCSLKADSEGHNMTAASDVLFTELGWTPSIHDQAADRTHRIGQKNAVTAWYLLGKNTIEEKIMSIIQDKRHLIEKVVEGENVTRNGGVFSMLLDEYKAEKQKVDNGKKLTK